MNHLRITPNPNHTTPMYRMLETADLNTNSVEINQKKYKKKNKTNTKTELPTRSSIVSNRSGDNKYTSTNRRTNAE